MSQDPILTSKGSQEEEEDFFGLDNFFPVCSPHLFTLFPLSNLLPK